MMSGDMRMIGGERGAELSGVRDGSSSFLE